MIIGLIIELCDAFSRPRPNTPSSPEGKQDAEKIYRRGAFYTRCSRDRPGHFNRYNCRGNRYIIILCIISVQLIYNNSDVRIISLYDLMCAIKNPRLSRGMLDGLSAKSTAIIDFRSLLYYLR